MYVCVSPEPVRLYILSPGTGVCKILIHKALLGSEGGRGNEQNYVRLQMKKFGINI